MFVSQPDHGPLHGVPVLLKDNIETLDMPTTASSLALAGNRTGRDAFLTGQLRSADLLIIGKSNLSEWANFRSARLADPVLVQRLTWWWGIIFSVAAARFRHAPATPTSPYLWDSCTGCRLEAGGVRKCRESEPSSQRGTRRNARDTTDGWTGRAVRGYRR
jgi:hypothetical protein